MSGGARKPSRRRRLWTRSLRRGLVAPDVERYLSARSVDLAVTDQLEALQVRVRKGMEVLERKIAGGTERAGKRLLSALAGAILALLASAAPLGTAARWTLLLTAGGCLVAAAAYIHDWVILRRSRSRHVGGIEKARTSQELLQFSESVLDDARALGVVPDDSPAG